jgi:protein-tyrosine phosphatase
MIDIHSHLLQVIDDGEKTLDESIALAKYAVNKGITHSVMTPHIHPGRYDNDINSIRCAFNCLKNALLEQKINLKIAYAAEVRISVEMMSLITQNKIPFLGEYHQQRILLLEFPHSHILPGSDKLIHWLNQRQIKSIIVHPERNKELQANPSKIIPFLKAGCLLQVTAGSLVGKFGMKSQKIARLLIENNGADFIASDAHNLKHRPPDLSEAYNYLLHTLGKNKANKFIFDNPWRIVRHHFISKKNNQD